MSRNITILCVLWVVVVGSLQFSDAWFLRKATNRRYSGPRIVVGDSITMPSADEAMVTYVKNSAIQKMKEYNRNKQTEMADEYYELPSAGEDNGSSGSSDGSWSIGLPLPFIFTGKKNSPRKNKEPVAAYSTISSSALLRANENRQRTPEHTSSYSLDSEPSSSSTISNSSPDFMKMVKVDFTGGNAKDAESIVKFFKMPTGGDDVTVGNSDSNNNNKRPMSFVIQWNLPMIFRKY